MATERDELIRKFDQSDEWRRAPLPVSKKKRDVFVSTRAGGFVVMLDDEYLILKESGWVETREIRKQDAQP